MSAANQRPESTAAERADAESGPELTSAARLWLVLMRAYRSIADVLEGQVASEGMCLSDFAVLEVLLHKGSLPISTIGERVLLTNASMTAAVDRLEGRGLVRRRADGVDRRVKLVELTTCGRELITAVFGRHEIEIERVMAGLNDASRARMRADLKTIGRAAKAMHEEQTAARRARQREPA